MTKRDGFEVIDYEIDPEQLSGQTLVISSRSPSYYAVLSMIESGLAHFLGERYDEDTTDRLVLVLFSPDPYAARSNPEMKVSSNFYTSILKDYESWEEKWWREVIQNAVDSGTRKIELGYEEQEDGSAIVSCRDYGRGMDEDTLLNKFLVLGGSSKADALTGATGGFGKAKELILLPWLTWSIHTRDLLATGTGTKYEVRKVERIDGTLVQVAMPADKKTRPALAINFVKKCYLPKIEFTLRHGSIGKLEEQTIEADLKPVKEIEEMAGKAVLYHNPADRMDWVRLLVRSNGIYHFSIDIDSAVPGLLILELTGRSIDLLTANRDGFRDAEIRREVSTFVNKVAKDVRSALKKKAGAMRTVFKGTEGKFEAKIEDVRREVLASAEFKKQKGKLDKSEIERVARTVEVIFEERVREIEVEDAGENEDERIPHHDQRPPEMRPDAEIARTLLSIDMNGPAHVEAALKQLAWAPDFYIINEEPDSPSWRETTVWKVPKRFLPAHMTPGLRRLARLWAELCRLVLIQLGSERPFGVGWVFSEGTQAAFTRDQGQDWLLLNPFRLGSMDRGKLWSTSEEDLDTLYALAIHECTHLANGVIHHDEAFSSALTYNIAKTLGGQRLARAVRRAVVARKFDAGVKTQVERPKLSEAPKVVEEPSSWYEIEYGHYTIAGAPSDEIAAVKIHRDHGEEIDYKPLVGLDDPWAVASREVKALTDGEIDPMNQWFSSLRAAKAILLNTQGPLAPLSLEVEINFWDPEHERFNLLIKKKGSA